MLERMFQLQANGTTVRTEVVAGLTTFLTMAYIVFVNPDILAAAGMPRDAVFVATCLAAALGSAIMGLYANYPVALAPAMGLNAYFAFTVVQGMGYTWQTALGAVFISGCLFILLSLFKVREWIVNAIPTSLKYSISAGIGLFLAVIGLKNAGLVVDHPATLVTLGDVTAWPALLAILGFVGGGGIGSILQQNVNLLQYRAAAVQVHVLVDVGELCAEGADGPLQHRVSGDPPRLMGDVPHLGAPVLKLHVPQPRSLTDDQFDGADVQAVEVGAEDKADGGLGVRADDGELHAAILQRLQTIARPGEEATPLSLASQLESEHPWADKRPPIS